MFWKMVLGLAIFGMVLGLIFIIIALRAFYTTTNENTEDIAFAGLIISILLLIISFLAMAISGIFVLRNNKKEWDAKNAK